VNLSENNNSLFIFDLYRKMNNYNLSYIYRGGFSIDLSNKILSLAETNMENIHESLTTKKKVYFIMVESLQNITRHQNVGTNGNVDDSSFFVIQRMGNDYYITSGNIVENKNIDSLKSKLSTVNNLDKLHLKEYYQDTLLQGEFSAKGGAGLGIIEMARKSGNKLAYDFKKINDDFSHFYFQIKITAPDAASTSQDMDAERFTWIEDLDETILEKNLHLIYQVDFTQENLISILSMIEGNIGGKDNLSLNKKIFNIIVELLQNIYQHADEPKADKEGKSGIFLIGEKDGEYTLTAGNLILNNRIETLKTRLDEVNKLNFIELDTLFNKILIRDKKDNEKGAGLGFIDLKMKSKNNIAYQFNAADEGYSFFEIQVKVSGK